MLKSLRKNNQGVVFVTVLMIIIVMMVLTISILSINVSQVVSTEEEVRRVKAEVLAKGFLWLMSANQMSQTPGTFIDETFDLDGTTFYVAANLDTSHGGPFCADELNIYVSY